MKESPAQSNNWNIKTTSDITDNRTTNSIIGMSLGIFGGYGIGTLARDGLSTGKKYISAIKVKMQVH